MVFNLPVWKKQEGNSSICNYQFIHLLKKCDAVVNIFRIVCPFHILSLFFFFFFLFHFVICSKCERLLQQEKLRRPFVHEGEKKMFFLKKKKKMFCLKSVNNKTTSLLCSERKKYNGAHSIEQKFKQLARAM